MSNSNLGTGTGGTSPYDDDSSTTNTPLPDFNASNIQLSTVAPAFGIPSSSLPTSSTAHQPDYLDYDQKGRGLVSTMFTNSGISYMLGVTFGGLYGLKEGLAKTPSTRWKVKLNSVLNHCGRHGSSVGNMLGATAILYSLYEGLADNLELDQYTGPIQPPAPLFAGAMTGATYYMRAGPRVATLAGAIGMGAVGGTFALYSVLGIPHGSKGWLFF
mmetsp:Transcript_3664/g.6894  ORF Transcript_3664/g.6894 Transcript_3664/m.6894 type:complete len:215 (-) Transcript_3664:350-994(-)|eukprot:CAMPEP_0183725084 /NCGR_PEP_ID=MMETSP0737-20130205/19610_1 /TAXON_ID=385413 /ORGANISM="Thalassiosira miniscula, Strain CCMP1093" /LENGTH=214 /DNA_ID=CAMNT_0025955913 /DNA_START=48 /DNA_END=692 /DNA_ORIENTATION=-